jgi:23S rRNA (guanine745-N1)-methyltransferase
LTRGGSLPVVVELGSGSGETLGTLAAAATIAGVGIDLSTAAAAHAARLFPAVTWVVANADRRLPLLDDSVDLVLSVHARRNPGECHRILRAGGFLLVAVPAADDLIELREAVQGDGLERDRAGILITEHEAFFSVVERATVRQPLNLDRAALLRLLRGTYRGERLSESERVRRLDRLQVTLASDIVVFQRADHQPHEGHEGHEGAFSP